MGILKMDYLSIREDVFYVLVNYRPVATGGLRFAAQQTRAVYPYKYKSRP